MQIFLFNNLSLSAYLNPLVYVVFIALLPMECSPLAMLLNGVAMGVADGWALAVGVLLGVGVALTSGSGVLLGLGVLLGFGVEVVSGLVVELVPEPPL